MEYLPDLSVLKTAGWFNVLRVVSERTEHIRAAFLAQVVASRRDSPSQQTNSDICCRARGKNNLNKRMFIKTY